MRTLHRAVAVAALGVAAIGTVGVGSASAANAHTSAAPAAVARPATIYPVPCWTSFAPGRPDGGPMVQYYANCANFAVEVCPEVIVNGQPTVYQVPEIAGPYDGIADDSDTAVWNYQATIPGANYTTVFC